MNSETKKFSFKMPHTFVILVIALTFTCLLTYLLPAGSYDRVKTDSGLTKVVLDSFKHVQGKQIGPWLIPNYIVKACIRQSALILPLIIIGGALEIVLATGMFNAYCSKMSLRFGDKGKLFIPVIMFLFALIGLTNEPIRFVSFAPIGVMLAMSLGYDAIVGVSIILLGIAIGFISGPYSIQTAAAQQLAELPVYSGLWLRWVSFAIFYVMCVFFIVRYAEKTKKHPELSPVYNDPDIIKLDLDPSHVENNPRHKYVLAIFVLGIATMVFGAMEYQWNLTEASIVFAWMGVVSGIVYGFSPSEIAKKFSKGCNGACAAAMIIGLGAAVSLILNEAKILDTVVHSMGVALNKVPTVFKAPVLFWMNLIINVFVPSGLGQAALVMPVFTPLADIAGVTRQTAVLAYKFGDGISNYVLPHVSSLTGFIAAAGIGYGKWMKFMWKLFVLWIVVATAIIAFAQIISYQ